MSFSFAFDVDVCSFNRYLQCLVMRDCLRMAANMDGNSEKSEKSPENNDTDPQEKGDDVSLESFITSEYDKQKVFCTNSIISSE